MEWRKEKIGRGTKESIGRCECWCKLTWISKYEKDIGNPRWNIELAWEQRGDYRKDKGKNQKQTEIGARERGQRRDGKILQG